MACGPPQTCWAVELSQPGGLASASLQAHIGLMVDLDKCLDSLRSLIADAHTNGIQMAEKAIEDYLAATPPPAQKEGLQTVQQAVQTHRDAAIGVHRSFADIVNDYIEEKMRAFE